MHKSRICYITIDVNDFDKAVEFYSKAFNAELEGFPTTGNSDTVYRRLKIPGSDIRLLLQLVPEEKACKTRVHLDIESDDIDAEADRLVKLGARKHKYMDERGFQFWIMFDPFGNEFCVLQPEYPKLLEHGNKWQ